MAATAALALGACSTARVVTGMMMATTPNLDAKPMVRTLDERLVPLAAPLDSAAPLEVLDPVFRGARIVGLGESTHGTREFYVLKRRAIQRAVLQHGYRAIAFELPAGAAALLDRYVRAEAGSALQPWLGRFWIYNTQEVQQLLEWLREHNRKVGPAAQVRVYGVDPQSNVDVMPWMRDIAGRVPELGARWTAPLDRLQAFFDLPEGAYAKQSATAQAAVVDAIAELRRLFEQNRASYAASLGAETLDMTVHLLDTLPQTEAMRKLRPEGSQAQALEAVTRRDAFMADNVAAVHGRIGRTVVWAHNFHVGNAFALDVSVPLAGKLLKERFGRDYQIVSLHFGTGSFIAYRRDRLGAQRLDDPPPQYSTDHLFHSAAVPDFYVDLSRLDTPAWVGWRKAPRGLWGVGSVFDPAMNYYALSVLPLDYADHVLYVRRATAAVSLAN